MMHLTPLRLNSDRVWVGRSAWNYRGIDARWSRSYYLNVTAMELAETARRPTPETRRLMAPAIFY